MLYTPDRASKAGRRRGTATGNIHDINISDRTSYYILRKAARKVKVMMGRRLTVTLQLEKKNLPSSSAFSWSSLSWKSARTDSVMKDVSGTEGEREQYFLPRVSICTMMDCLSLVHIKPGSGRRTGGLEVLPGKTPTADCFQVC